MGDETSADVHPLLRRLLAETRAAAPGPADFDAWAQGPGDALAVFADEPALHRETLDLAVIVPELWRAFPGRFRVALPPPGAARAIAPRYGLRRWPALVLLRGGAYVGAIEGLRDWSEYRAELARLLDSPPARPPTIGIPVRPG